MSHFSPLRSLTTALMLAVIASIASAPNAWAQATDNPIPTSAPIASWAIELEDVVTIPDSNGSAPRLEQLVWNEATGLAYVIDARGFIYTFDPFAAAPVARLFLDLGAAVGDLFLSNEAGVRSMAFHPDFDDATSAGYRKLYVTFSRITQAPAVGNPTDFTSPGSTDHRTILGEWTLLTNGTVDLSAYRELFRVEQPYVNHNGGHLGFDPRRMPDDPDYGLLYIALGDGGSFGDPFDLAQDIDATPAPYPHGKILRIDPLANGNAPYSIPSTNPFAGDANRLEEAWAWGFRNPHKFHWDRSTGNLYVSDIGQGVVEEIHLVRQRQNAGWSDREGTFVYTSADSVSPLPSGHETDAFAYPVAQYDHSTNGVLGSSAIVGGPVYRGSAIPALAGTMFFADFATNPGPIFAVHVNQLLERNDFSAIANLDDGRLAPFEEVRIQDGGSDKTFRDFLRDSTADPAIQRTDLRFGEGPDGDIYILNKRDGIVRLIVAAPGHPGPPRSVPGLGVIGLGVVLGSAIAVARSRQHA